MDVTTNTKTEGDTMTQHEAYAKRQGRTLVSIQGRYEHWHSPTTGNWLYNLDTHRWIPAYVTIK